MKTVAQFREHLGPQAVGVPDAELQEALDVESFRSHLGDAAANASDAELLEAVRAARAESPPVALATESWQELQKSLEVEREQRQTLAGELDVLKAMLAQQAEILKALQALAAREPAPANLTVPTGAFAPVNQTVNHIDVTPVPVNVSFPEGGVVNNFAPNNTIEVNPVPVTLVMPPGGLNNYFTPKIDVHPAAAPNVNLPPMQVTVIFPRVKSVLRTVQRKDGDIVGTRDDYIYEG